MTDGNVLAGYASIETLASECGVSGRTVRRWIDRGGLPYHRLGGRRLVRRSDFDAWLTGRRTVRRPAA